MALKNSDYTIAWISPLYHERASAEALLDEEHRDLPLYPGDDNVYSFGRIGQHNVVIAGLPSGTYGTTSAATVATNLLRSFTNIKFGLLVGIGGGLPSLDTSRLGNLGLGDTRLGDLRLGDVVVSIPEGSGVIQYDFGTAIQGRKLVQKGSLNKPPSILTNAVNKLQSKAERKGYGFQQYLDGMLERNPRMKPNFAHPNQDDLYESDYVHENSKADCIDCSAERLVPRPARVDQEPLVFYGTIGSANQVLRNAHVRDDLHKQSGIICFEMEAAGLMDNFPCIVIRGICDYSDTHKNDGWQGYAAAIAAIFAKKLLEIIPSRDIESIGSVEKQLSAAIPVQNKADTETLQHLVTQADTAIHEYYMLGDRLKIERLSGETLSLEKCYINLALKDFSDERRHRNDRLSHFPKAENQIALDDIFNSRKLPDGTTINPNRIFIQGRAGIGKTTLCKKIVDEFLQHRFHQNFDRLLWLSLRNLENRNAKYEWLELLQDVFTPSPQVPDWDTLVVEFSKQFSKQDFRCRTLILMDGLDEVSYQKDSKVCKFLEAVICDMPNIIITSRPQANRLKIGQFDLQLETVGFTREQIDTYIENCVTDKHASSCMKELIIRKPILQELLRIPVQLDAFCCTWYLEESHGRDDLMLSTKGGFQVIKEESLSTMTTLYSSISIELCRKDLVRTGRYNQSHILRTNEVMRLLTNELKFLEELAFQGLFNGIVDFHPRHQESIDVHFKQSGNSKLPLEYSSTLEQLSFLRTSGLQQHRHKRIYHFIHLTFQEFFAAKYYVRHWKIDADLTCLNLDPADTGKVMRSPLKFLQIERYNPRYNIFWRFVTGLVQTQQEQETVIYQNNKTILEFFNEFDDESQDLLGPGHRRQIMYFLSELLPSKRIEIVSLRARMENLLREEMIREHKLSRYDDELIAVRLIAGSNIGYETEFPESILYSFLQDETNLPYKFTLNVLGARPFLTARTLQSVLDLTRAKFATEVQIQAIQIVFKNSRADSQEIVAQAVQNFCVLLKDINPKIREEAVMSCWRWKFPVPPRAAIALIARLRDNDIVVRSSAIFAMGVATSLHQPAITALIKILESKDFDVRSSAISILKEQLDLDHKAVVALCTTFKHEGSIMQFYVAYALKEQSILPQEIIAYLVTCDWNGSGFWRDHKFHSLLDKYGSLNKDRKPRPALFAALRAEDVFVQSSALCAIGERLFLPQETTASLITKLRDGFPHKQGRSWICRHGGLSEEPSLPQEAVPALIAALDDENILVRSSAAYVLAEHSFSSEAVITALITAFKVEIKVKHSPVRFYIVEALAKQPSLSEKAVEAITTHLKDRKLSVRSDVVYILKEQLSLPQETITALIITLNDKYKYVRIYAAKALATQSSLPHEAMVALITILFQGLQDDNYTARASIIQTLQRQLFLPQEAVATIITALVTIDEDKDKRTQSSTVNIFKPRSRHHDYREAIAALVSPYKDKDWSARHKIVKVLVATLKNEDSHVRLSIVHGLGVFPSLPQEAVTALVTTLEEDKDYSVKCMAAEVVGRQSFLPQEAITALMAAIKDKNIDVGLPALHALREPSLPQELVTALFKDEEFGTRSFAVGILQNLKWLALSEEATASLIEIWITLLKNKDKDEDGDVRSISAGKLGELSPLPGKVVTALATALNDERKRVRESAACALKGHSSLPKEVVAALISALITQFIYGYWEIDDYFTDPLIRWSPLPQEAISDLVAALKHDNERVRYCAVTILREQPSLPQEAIAPLMKAITKGYEWADPQDLIMSIVTGQLSRPSEAIVALITTLKDLEYQADGLYDILHRDDLFYSTIKDLDDQTWRYLWSYWCSVDSDNEFCCYELEGSLYLWSKGELQQISNEPSRTQEMLGALLGEAIQKSKAQDVIEVDLTKTHSDNTLIKRARTAATSESKSRSILRFKKRKIDS